MIPWKSWDPWILFSWVNTKLRDQYADLASLCEEEQMDRDALEEALQAIHCRYVEALGRFVPDTEA